MRETMNKDNYFKTFFVKLDYKITRHELNSIRPDVVDPITKSIVASEDRVIMAKMKAIFHYEKMIEWAKKQNKKLLVIPIEMYNAIGEDWSSYYCSFCHLHNNDCINCVLGDGKNRDCHCCGGLWAKMNEAKNWGEWVKAANKVLKYIKKAW